MKKNVFIIQRRMTGYRIPLFEALRDRLAEEDIRLQVVYGSPTKEETLRRDEAILPWGLKVPCHYLKIGSALLVWQDISRALLDEQDLIIIPHENSMLLTHWRLLLSGAGKGKIAFWGHGANFQSSNPWGHRERLKAWNLRQAGWWFAYTTASVRRIMIKGFPGERITCLNNTVDTDRMVEWRRSITAAEAQSLRERLGLRSENVGLFLGSLYKEKRLNFLFSAVDEVRARMPDFELLIIGDGPLRQAVIDFGTSRPWVKWVGSRHGREKVLYASLGRLMLNPGLVGLNILDSFALGIPMITTDCGIHSPEIAYFESGRNGLMVEDNLAAFREGITSMMRDAVRRDAMKASCLHDISLYPLSKMAQNFSEGIKSALAAPERVVFTKSISTVTPSLCGETGRDLGRHIAIIWQRFLPYHKARIRHAQNRFKALGFRLTAIEVASQDASYGFPADSVDGVFERICCFAESSYHDHGAKEIYRTVLRTLTDLKPDVVFAPATAFPEGMAAVTYRRRNGARTIMMDDAWERSDSRGPHVRMAKRIIHENVDGAFVPAISHLSYYRKLGFTDERVVFGVDVVDNEYFSSRAERARLNAQRIRPGRQLPRNYFLFVGRFLPRKGLETLVAAYKRYCARAKGALWEMVLVGTGSYLDALRQLIDGFQGIHVAGERFGDDLCEYYGLADAVIVPSDTDPWGLVVNEAMASSLPVIVSSGCGAAETLVREGENGWTFDPGNVDALSDIMLNVAALPPDALLRIGKRSQAIIAAWSLDRFVDGALKALEIPRRRPAGFIADIATRLWKGRVSIT